ncbi:MAG: hypothetical protein QOF02_1353 [Blastocatellia bacterium]|jgi:hypothetical protein|nr:hypothetical protein [Blastocatellia bacterium]
MNSRFLRRRASLRRAVLSALICAPCLLFMSGCGTSRESANSYTQSVTAVDENGAVRTLGVISKAQLQYSITNGGEYGMFEDLTRSGLLDSRFAGHTPELGGYVYTIKLAPASGGEAAKFVVYADPKTPASGIQTKGRHLYVDSTNSVVHANATQQASASDPAFP